MDNLSLSNPIVRCGMLRVISTILYSAGDDFLVEGNSACKDMLMKFFTADRLTNISQYFLATASSELQSAGALTGSEDRVCFNAESLLYALEISRFVNSLCNDKTKSDRKGNNNRKASSTAIAVNLLDELVAYYTSLSKRADESNNEDLGNSLKYLKSKTAETIAQFYFSIGKEVPFQFGIKKLCVSKFYLNCLG